MHPLPACKPDGSIMVVDDNTEILNLLHTLLHEGGYRVRAVADGELALSSIRQQPPELLILDIRMPGMDGLELCRRAKALPGMRDLPVIFVSGQQSIAEKAAAFADGGVDYIVKPFHSQELMMRVSTHWRLARLQRNLVAQVELRTGELHRSEERSRLLLDQMMAAVATLSHQRSPYIANHQSRTARLAEALAHLLGWSEERCRGVRFGALIHDIGEFSLPSDLFMRTGRLNAIERKLMHGHCEAGLRIVEGIDFPWPIGAIVAQHHERLDGSGYPFGLLAEAILPESRLIAIADVVEAISSHRPWRPALGIGAAIEEIVSGRATRYDPEMVDGCRQLLTGPEPWRWE